MSNVTYEYGEWWECSVIGEATSYRHYFPVSEGSVEAQLGLDEGEESDILERKVVGGWGRLEHYPLGEVYCTGVGFTQKLADVRADVNKLLMNLWHDYSIDLPVYRGVFVDLGDGTERIWTPDIDHGPLGKRIEGVGAYSPENDSWRVFRSFIGVRHYLQVMYASIEELTKQMGRPHAND